MKQNLKISGKIFSLDFPQANEAKWSFEKRPGGWLVASRPGLANEGLQRKRIFLHEAKGKLSVLLEAQLLFGELQNSISYARHSDGNASFAPHSGAVAEFPGKVRKIMVKQGDFVEVGAVLLLMEAMKMEFSIRSPYEARIKKILVQEGQQVSPGDIFLEFEQRTEPHEAK